MKMDLCCPLFLFSLIQLRITAVVGVITEIDMDINRYINIYTFLLEIKQYLFKKQVHALIIYVCV